MSVPQSFSALLASSVPNVASWVFAVVHLSMMNTDEQQYGGGGLRGHGVGAGEVRDPMARTDLRARLEAGRIARGLNQTELARAAGLGRTTVSQALSATASAPPSADTVGALARVLRLDFSVLSALLDAALGRGAAAVADREVPGRPITQWDPHDLEVHPAAEVPAAVVDPAVVAPVMGRQHDGKGGGVRGRATSLPGYVRRPHDEELATVVLAAQAGHSGMAVLVGPSSAGKTRACWESVQPLAHQGWRLWHPFDPTRAEAALADLVRVAPCTVVWLNEAQHYFGAGAGVGERIAAAVHNLLTAPARAPVLVLATLWPEYADVYTALPEPEAPDAHPRVRELLAGRQIVLPDSFDTDATHRAEVLAAAGDRQLAHALHHMNSGRLTQFLAGAPELLRRHATSSPSARALLHAAMDARRLGAGLHLPAAFLGQAAEDYLGDDEYDDLTDNWLEQAIADTTRPVHGRLAPLRRVRPRPTRPGAPAVNPPGMSYRLADYLEQHGRHQRAHLCPPESFWQAAHDHFGADDLSRLATAARVRHRLRWSERLFRRAADTGSATALLWLARMREDAGDRRSAEEIARRAAEVGNTASLLWLARMREREGDAQAAELLYRRAAGDGSIPALVHLARIRDEEGDREEAEEIARQAADAGDTTALIRLAAMREAGDEERAELLYQHAADVGDLGALFWLARLREQRGDPEGAERIALRAAEAGHPTALMRFTRLRETSGDREGAERIALRAADAGDPDVLAWLAMAREKNEERLEAERLHQLAADAGDPLALLWLTLLRNEDGDLEGAEETVPQAAATTDPAALVRLAERRARAGDRKAAQRLCGLAADAGDLRALVRLAEMREHDGDPQEVERLYRRAVDAGAPGALGRLAALRERDGALQEAAALYQRAADAGDTGALLWLAKAREQDGDQGGAEQPARQAAAAGDTTVWLWLAEAREEKGDREGAERIARQAADAGSISVLFWLAKIRDTAAADRETSLWPYGLDPDGGPTPPW